MAIGTMLGHLARNWGWIVLRGVVAILFGIFAFIRPGITLSVLVLVWGIYAFADGLLALFAAFKIRDEGRPLWPLIIVGLLGVAAGIATFMVPGMTAIVLLAFIAGWAVAMGVFQIVAAIRLRKVITNEWLMGLSGLLSVAFGVLMFARPGAGALAVVWIIGWYAILFGLTLVTLGFRLKGLVAHVPRPA
jgi:uncharacterized membrane protein HdeD (DUF308 family)